MHARIRSLDEDSKVAHFPMELLKRTRERRGVAVFALVLAIALVFALAYTVVSSRSATDAAIESVSEVYLRELGDQVIAHFNTGIESKFNEVKTVGASLAVMEPDTMQEAVGLLSAQMDGGDYSYLALEGDDGLFYTAEGVYEAQVDPLSRDEATLSYHDSEGHEVLFHDGMLALINPIDPVRCGSVSFTEVVACYDVTLLSQRLDLGMFDGGSRSSLMMRDGTCIVGCADGDMQDGGNVFQALESNVTFEEEGELERVEESVKAGKTCLLPFTYGTEREYLYFRPIDNSNWYLVTAMPFGIVDDDIAALTGVLVQNAAIMGAALVVVAAASFFLYSKLMKRNNRLLAEEKNRAEAASERAQRASLAKSEFLSRMSHEIRTPMNGIMGMTAIARESIGDDEKVRACLDKVSATSRHLMALINDILDMSKIESGKVEIKREPFELRPFVDSFTAVFKEQGSNLGIRYATEERGSLPAWVIGDALRLNQIVYNLVGNAFKFTPRGGSVTLRIERMSEAPLSCIPEESDGEGVRSDAGEEDTLWVRFSVIDTGCGIKPENFQRIFSSFNQGDASIAREYGGTGLGLAITKRFTEMMGGRIMLESEVGKGSTFSVEVPLGLMTGEAVAERPASGAPGFAPPSAHEDESFDFSGKRLLVAEDNELNREIAFEILAVTGAEVHAVETGAQAVRTFESSPPGYFDLVLMDIQMPELDGCEATRVIRALDRPDARSVPILAMTADAFVEDEERSRRCGMDSHLSKPLDIHLVYATIDKFLRETSRDDGAAG